ncbi:MAG TPA: hypothetical protein VMA71_01800 [Alloacidobacterium sp.]|nr:hypothetical protein [Alloacidobacterium sp.]
MQDPVEVADSNKESHQKEPRSGRFRTGLLIIGSALLGGIAVALWNRRSLTDMQSKVQEKDAKPLPVDDDAIY